MTAAPRRVLVTGAHGQLGNSLQRSAPPGTGLTALDIGDLDIGNRDQVLETVARLNPQLIVNAAAYTAVDDAEKNRELAFRINGEAVGHLAEAAARCGARLVHVSTDYVFDGKAATPYRPDSPTHPLNVYGQSKLAGERAALERSGGRALVVRTAWVYAAAGRNFVNTLLRLMRERPELRVVDDQVGSPTHAASLARAIWQLCEYPDTHGIWHWTDAGVCSWYDFAVAIRNEAGALGFGLPHCSIVPIPSSAYPTPAARPAYGVLDKDATWQKIGPARHWQAELRDCLAEHLRRPKP